MTFTDVETSKDEDDSNNSLWQPWQHLKRNRSKQTNRFSSCLFLDMMYDNVQQNITEQNCVSFVQQPLQPSYKSKLAYFFLRLNNI